MKNFDKTTTSSHRLFIGAFASIDNYSLLKEELDPFFDGKWIEKKNLHMTFKFLGDVTNIEKIIEKLKKLHYVKKQTVVFKRFKLFHKNILSLRSSNKTLYKIEDQINELLGDKVLKEKNFKPHITLMRVKKIKDANYKEKFKILEFSAQLNLKVCLVESIMKPDGVKYKIIREF